MNKLYHENSHLYEFTAKVTAVRTEDNCKAIILDRTAFFPMGGGQPGDEGKIGNAEIFDTREVDGEILHYTKDEPDFSTGDTVECKLDEELRCSRMQAHSGEHIFSGVAHNIFGVQNVGFHMLDLVMTVDFDLPLSKEQVEIIEAEANKWVYRNVSVTAEILSGEKLSALQYRSKLDLDTDVRIVTVEGCDKCACCAPHVSNTGEIGLIKVLSCISHRGGVRITLVCGAKAFEDYCFKHKDIMQISDLLKAPNNETPKAVEELYEKISEEKRNAHCKSQRLYNYIYNSLNQSTDSVVLFVDDFAPDELRELADLCKTKTSALMAVFSGNDSEGYAYAISSVNIPLKQLSATVNSALSGRGGGRNEMLQGRISANKNAINDFFNEFEVKLHENA